jgi:peptidoglycan/LPS O-acetylase OafA/YrhL
MTLMLVLPFAWIFYLLIELPIQEPGHRWGAAD